MGSPKPSPCRIRLQRYLAQCGLGSRRACERLIDEGVVTIDGETVTRQGHSVDPSHQIVRVRGLAVMPEPLVYLVLYRPRGILCTSHDPEGRKTIHGLLPRGLLSRVYTVGRLDRDSEGLLLVTNDGDFAHALMHPRHQVAKTYHVQVNRLVTDSDRRNLERGLIVEGERLRALSFRRRNLPSDRPTYEVVLGEGRNRHIRRMLEARGYQIARLKRVAIGELRLGRMAPGACRPLTEPEMDMLMEKKKGRGRRPEGGGRRSEVGSET